MGGRPFVYTPPQCSADLMGGRPFVYKAPIEAPPTRVVGALISRGVAGVGSWEVGQWLPFNAQDPWCRSRGLAHQTQYQKGDY